MNINDDMGYIINDGAMNHSEKINYYFYHKFNFIKLH